MVTDGLLQVIDQCNATFTSSHTTILQWNHFDLPSFRSVCGYMIPPTLSVSAYIQATYRNTVEDWRQQQNGKDPIGSGFLAWLSPACEELSSGESKDKGTEI
ncbi:hypothetical protein Bbelb_073910 [Branchiostoma belcheri]|nr:hypothetical protein Bbelb_073910 [Branchiostoma belcheri]